MNRKDREENTVRTKLERIPPTNRAVVEKYLNFSRINSRNKISTLRLKATALEELDREIGNVALGTVTFDDLQSWLEAISFAEPDPKAEPGSKPRGPISPETVRTKVRIARAFYNWLYDKEVPRHIARALETRIDRVTFRTPVISEHEFAKLFAAPVSFRTKTLLATLFDTGLRASEFTALNCDGIRFIDENRARVAIPANAEYLKTGPREITVSGCTPRLRQWLRIHPHQTGGDCPLFGSESSKRPGGRLEYWGLSSALRQACQRAEIRRLNPHLFRHSRATQMAGESGVNETKMRMFFGWSERSSMPSRYIHLNIKHLDDLAQHEHELRMKAQVAEATGTVHVRQPDLLAEFLKTQQRQTELLARLLDPNTRDPTHSDSGGNGK